MSINRYNVVQNCALPEGFAVEIEKVGDHKEVYFCYQFAVNPRIKSSICYTDEYFDSEILKSKHVEEKLRGLFGLRIEKKWVQV